MPTNSGHATFKLDTNSSIPDVLTYGTAIASFALFGLGGIMFWTDQRRLSRRKVVVVESRGLRDSVGASLAQAVPASIRGRREQIFLDLRQRVKDGVIVEPRVAAARVLGLPRDLDALTHGLDRSDVSVVYGGLAPVPLTFLTGVLFDDESPVTVMDWDRHAERWRMLDGHDDGRRFSVEGFDLLPDLPQEVALAVSVSYKVDLDGVGKKVGGIPVVHLRLDESSVDAHWSEQKQIALGRSFLDLAVQLADRGTKHIHLFMAAQNSVVFRFARLYDKRNLPGLTVYQYERDAQPPYPWSIAMPVAGLESPRLDQTGELDT